MRLQSKNATQWITGSLIGCLMALLASCGGDDSKTDGRAAVFKGQEILILEGADTLNITETEISGTGLVAFVSSLGSSDGGASFGLSAKLEAGGRMELITFGSSTLSEGVSFVLSRSGESLQLSYSSGGRTHDMSGAIPTGDNMWPATEPIPLWIDVHNDESPLHILLWNPKGISKDSASEDAAFFNSESLLKPEERESGRYTFPSQNGSGEFWGIRLSQATVLEARAGEPLYEEGQE